MDEIAARVENFHNGAKAFAAIKELKDQAPRSKVIVHDEMNEIIHDKEKAVEKIASHFKSQFTSKEAEELEPFFGNPRPLKNPISIEEVENAIRRLKNRKAVGPDALPIEVIKATGKEGAIFIAKVLNKAFEKHESLDVGRGILSAIQKVGKPKGPMSSLRPIVLLTCLRKILSLITLYRIRDKVEVFISPSQAAYRKGRATTDIVWAHRWIIATAIRFKSEIHILGLDMSRAFDTISRTKMMNILRVDVGLEDDELRMCQLLLANTTLQVRLEEVLSNPFKTTIGTPQGDGLSPILFIIYLERALKDVRNKAPPKPIEDKDIPSEAIYADDTDFISKNAEYLKKLEAIIPNSIGAYDLVANASKWERTKITQDTDDQWKKVKKLGSLLGDEEDIQRRMHLARRQFKYGDTGKK